MAVHAPPAQPAAAKRVLSEPDRPLELLQDLDPAVGKDLGDDHPQRVVADVDGGHRGGRRLAGGIGFARLHGFRHALAAHARPLAATPLRVPDAGWPLPPGACSSPAGGTASPPGEV